VQVLREGLARLRTMYGKAGKSCGLRLSRRGSKRHGVQPPPCSFPCLQLLAALLWLVLITFLFASRSRHTRCLSDWSSDVCSSDLLKNGPFDLDLVFAPDGIETFADAWRRRVEVAPVCHLDDIIASKAAANRVRDREVLPRL